MIQELRIFFFGLLTTFAMGGCLPQGGLTPDAQNALSAAGRYISAGTKCLDAVLTAEEKAARERDRDIVLGYLCDKGTQEDKDVIAGTEEALCEPSAPGIAPDP